MTLAGRAASLTGRTALVTGATSLIGTATAQALISAGAAVTLLARDAARLESLRAELGAAGVIACDLTAADARERLAATDAAARCDILVACVGGTRGLGAPAWAIGDDAFGEMITLNLATAHRAMAATMPGMVARGHGRVVLVAGTYGLRGRAGRAAYSAAKWGLRGLAKAAALDAAPHGVTVNCLCPGLVAGPRAEELADALVAGGLDRAAAEAKLNAGIPTGRMTRPEEIAAAVVMLCGDAAAQITGQDLALDGGWSV